jgi:hypothetical protein
MSILFEYLYRDAGNNKLWGDILLSNQKGLDVRHAESVIRSSLIDGEFFVAEDLNIPVLSFQRRDPDLDHGWHEFHSLEVAENVHDGSSKRDLSDFLQEMQAASEKWKRVS